MLHDAGEAYTGDIPRPLKAEYELVDRVEQRILTAVWDSFEIDTPREGEWERVMAADDRLLAHEADVLLEDGSWTERSPELEYELRSDDADEIRERFVTRVETLFDRL